MTSNVGSAQRIKQLLNAIKPGVLIWILALSSNLLIGKLLQQSNNSAFGGWITLMVCLVAIRLFSVRTLRDHDAPSFKAGLRLGLRFLILVAGLDALFLGWASNKACTTL